MFEWCDWLSEWEQVCKVSEFYYRGKAISKKIQAYLELLDEQISSEEVWNDMIHPETIFK